MACSRENSVLVRLCHDHGTECKVIGREKFASVAGVVWVTADEGLFLTVRFR